MKLFKLSTFFTTLCLLLSMSCDSQINLKSAKNKLKSKAKTEMKSHSSKQTKSNSIVMNTNNPCESNGTVKVAQGNKAFTSYKNCLKQLEVAERNISKGIYPDTQIKLAQRNMSSVLKKEPNADLSELCQRLQNIEKEGEALLPEPAQASYNPCEKGGSLRLSEGDKGFERYKRAIERVEVAERFVASGNNAEQQVTLAKNALLGVLEEEPNADISELCGRLQKIKSSPESIVNLAKYFDEQRRIVTTVYFDKSKGVYPDELGLQNAGWFLERVEGFNREEALSKAQDSNDKNAKELVEVLNDYSAFLDRQGVDGYLMDLLDEYNNASSDQLMKRAKEINSVAKALKNLAGSNAGMDRVIAFTQKQLGKADSALANIYSSETHKEYINQVVFTKQPFRPGGEGSLEINPTFKAGDAVYATIYLGATIDGAVSSWQGYGKGGTMGLKVKNSNGDLMNSRFEGSEDYNNSFVSIPESVSKSQTIIQFVLIPNLESSISEYLKCGNITPISMAKGMSEESDRLKEFTVQVNGAGKKTGVIFYKGTFKMDLGVGEGSAYYKKVELNKSEAFFASNPLPTAKINNASLEAQLLAEMKKQGFQEQFKKAYIQTNWKLFKPFNQEQYREMTASFTYTTSDGKCGWQNYSFRSFKTGSGWSGPQKWGGANQRQRMSCKKMK